MHLITNMRARTHSLAHGESLHTLTQLNMTTEKHLATHTGCISRVLSLSLTQYHTFTLHIIHRSHKSKSCIQAEPRLLHTPLYTCGCLCTCTHAYANWIRQLSISTLFKHADSQVSDLTVEPWLFGCKGTQMYIIPFSHTPSSEPNLWKYSRRPVSRI